MVRLVMNVVLAKSCTEMLERSRGAPHLGLNSCEASNTPHQINSVCNFIGKQQNLQLLPGDVFDTEIRSLSDHRRQQHRQC